MINENHDFRHMARGSAVLDKLARVAKLISLAIAFRLHRESSRGPKWGWVRLLQSMVVRLC
jgi:hypothetical protein